MNAIKKIGFGMLALMVLLVVGVIVLQVLIDPNDYKESIRQRAAEQGIELAIKGNIHWSFFPALAFTMDDVDAAVPVGDNRQALHIGQLKMTLLMAPLMDRKIEFRSVEIKDANAQLGKTGSQSQSLNDIDLLIEDLNSSGRPFPVSLSLVYVHDALQVPIQLKTEAAVNLAEKQSFRVVLDPLDITVDKNTINGSIQWQKGTPDHLAIHLKSDTLLVQHSTLANVQLDATMDGKKVTLQTLQAEAYEGQVRNNGSIDLSDEKVAQLRLDTEIKGVQLAPLLADWQQKPSRILAGSLQLDSRLTAMPLSRAGILKTLSGNLQFSVSGMVIDEMNIEKRVCEAAAQLDGKSLSAKQWSEKTELRDTRGTAQLQNGIMFLSPLAAKLDTLDLNGIGPVNLLDNTMDLKLDLKAVDDRQAVNACEIMNPRLAEISWPLRCRGNFSTQSGKELCSIDQSRLDKLVLQAAEQKLGEKLKEKMGKDGEKLKDALKGLFH